MTKITTASLYFLAVGIFTSVTILSGFQVLFAIPLIYFSVLAIRNKQSHLPKSAWFLIAFILICLLSLALNFEILPKPGKNFGKVKYFAYAVGGIWVFNVWLKDVSDQTRKNLFRIFCISLVAAGSYAIWQKSSGRIRASGLTETMRYGYGSAIALLFILSSTLQRQRLSWVDVKFSIPAFIIGFIGMYLTYTRGALLGFLCGLPFAIYFYRPKIAYYVSGAALLIILTLIGFNQFGSGQYSSRFLKNKSDSSDGIRRSIWTAALIATKEKPVLGWGYANFHSQLKRIKDQNQLAYPEYNDAHAHNLYLDILAGTGVLGLLVFLGWLTFWAWECFKSPSLVKALIIPLGAAFTVSSFFEMSLSANTACMIFAFYSLSISCLNAGRDDQKSIN